MEGFTQDCDKGQGLEDALRDNETEFPCCEYHVSPPSFHSLISCLIFVAYVFVYHDCLAQHSCNMATTGHGQGGSMHHQQQAHEANCLSCFGWFPHHGTRWFGDGGEWELNLV